MANEGRLLAELQTPQRAVELARRLLGLEVSAVNRLLYQLERQNRVTRRVEPGRSAPIWSVRSEAPLGESAFYELKGTTEGTALWHWSSFKLCFQAHAGRTLTAFANTAVTRRPSATPRLVLGVSDQSHTQHGVTYERRGCTLSAVDLLRTIEDRLERQLRQQFSESFAPSQLASAFCDAIEFRFDLLRNSPEELVFLLELRLHLARLPVELQSHSLLGCSWQGDFVQRDGSSTVTIARRV